MKLSEMGTTIQAQEGRSMEVSAEEASSYTKCQESLFATKFGFDFIDKERERERRSRL